MTVKSSYVSHPGLVAVAIAATAIQSAALAGNLCQRCPVPGVDSHATTSLGTPKAGGPCATGRATNGYPLPDPSCTPGAFNPTVPASVFGAKKFSTKCVRDCVTGSGQKKTTYAAYQVSQNSSCELDHLVPLEMGGADSLDNIWPQCGKAPSGRNYKAIKDMVETYLAIQVLTGMDLDQARKGIASDWTQYIDDSQKFCASNSCDISHYRK
ncbi:MAG TPA: HNH endonuclease signature motif containing protein [Bryobacteraceae bacterium]|nr:HNH endonuclease signature motif containing protein [Bryobacteraceae bacterium]